MRGLEVVVVGVLVLPGGVLGRRLHLPAPLVQLGLGVGIGLVPGLGDVEELELRHVDLDGATDDD